MAVGHWPLGGYRGWQTAQQDPLHLQRCYRGAYEWHVTGSWRLASWLGAEMEEQSVPQDAIACSPAISAGSWLLNGSMLYDSWLR